MTGLSDRLERLGLAQYLEALISEGFDTWETVLDITESDLTYLNVKLGHRRKLQRAIAETRGQPQDRALTTEPRKSVGNDAGYRSDDSGVEPRDASTVASTGSITGAAAASNTGTKRKYRRHPKPDSNAPERPPSAYVIFSNQVREELKGQELSFTEIAKVVGERWQILPTEVREACEQQANTAKEKYYAELAEYKKTTEFAQYQEYLAEFKAKHGPSRSEGKRSKLESETSSASLPATHPDVTERPQGGSNSAPMMIGGIPRSSGSCPPATATSRPHTAFRRPSSSGSPAMYADANHSPVRPDSYSPGPSSPASSNALTLRDLRGSGRPGNVEGRQRDHSLPGHHPPQQQSAYPSYRPGDQRSESGPQQLGYFTALPGRPSHDSPTSRPPALTHQGSTLSSAESVPQYPPAGTLLPMLEGSKSGRMLPQPIMASNTRISPLDRHQVSLPPPQALPPIGQGVATSQEGQRGSNWPALLRATELAREADQRSGSRRRDAQDEPP